MCGFQLKKFTRWLHCIWAVHVDGYVGNADGSSRRCRTLIVILLSFVFLRSSFGEWIKTILCLSVSGFVFYPHFVKNVYFRRIHCSGGRLAGLYMHDIRWDSVCACVFISHAGKMVHSIVFLLFTILWFSTLLSIIIPFLIEVCWFRCSGIVYTMLNGTYLHSLDHQK